MKLSSKIRTKNVTIEVAGGRRAARHCGDVGHCGDVRHCGDVSHCGDVVGHCGDVRHCGDVSAA